MTESDVEVPRTPSICSQEFTVNSSFSVVPENIFVTGPNCNITTLDALEIPFNSAFHLTANGGVKLYSRPVWHITDNVNIKNCKLRYLSPLTTSLSVSSYENFKSDDQTVPCSPACIMKKETFWDALSEIDMFINQPSVSSQGLKTIDSSSHNQLTEEYIKVGNFKSHLPSHVEEACGVKSVLTKPKCYFIKEQSSLNTTINQQDTAEETLLPGIFGYDKKNMEVATLMDYKHISESSNLRIHSKNNEDGPLFMKNNIKSHQRAIQQERRTRFSHSTEVENCTFINFSFTSGDVFS